MFPYQKYILASVSIAIANNRRFGTSTPPATTSTRSCTTTTSSSTSRMQNSIFFEGDLVLMAMLTTDVGQMIFLRTL
jgi:hypothetical protein